MFSRNSSLKEVFAALSEWSKNNDSSQDFWTLVSAIRGPDDNKPAAQSFKEKYVYPLRSTLLPGHPYAGSGKRLFTATEAQTKLTELRNTPSSTSVNGHFFSHLLNAYAALVRMLGGGVTVVRTTQPRTIQPSTPVVAAKAPAPNTDAFWWQ